MCNSTFKCIPNNLKLLLPHDSFQLVLMVSVLYFFFPIQTTLVLSKFILRPEYFALLDSTLRVSFKRWMNHLILTMYHLHIVTTCIRYY